MAPLKFHPDATVEEITDIGRHAVFDEVIHDRDDDFIQAIWYPEGEHNHVDELLELLTY